MSKTKAPAFTMPKGAELADSAPFKDGDVYRFPFVALDQTPGGSNLGRIEWSVEFVPKTRGHKTLVGVCVWARQTRDPRYCGKAFYIPVNAAFITTQGRTRIDKTCGSFFAGAWRAYICQTHGFTVIESYPENHHVCLVVDVSSSISNDIYFEEARR